MLKLIIFNPMLHYFITSIFQKKKLWRNIFLILSIIHILDQSKFQRHLMESGSKTLILWYIILKTLYTNTYLLLLIGLTRLEVNWICNCNQRPIIKNRIGILIKKKKKKIKKKQNRKVFKDVSLSYMYGWGL